MRISILFFSFLSVLGCASSGVEGPDLLGIQVDATHPETSGVPSRARLNVFVFPHRNDFGDNVSGAWIGVADPRSE